MVRKVVVGVVFVMAMSTALAMTGTATADPHRYPPPTPRPTTLYLDRFVLSSQVHYSESNFWCEFYGYAAHFSNYTGLCPYQDFIATVHWKKVQQITEYDICYQAKPVFSVSPVVGWSCYGMDPTKSGSPDTLSMTFDSAAMPLNSHQGTDQMWMVKTCNLDPVTSDGGCAESNIVTAEVPWTG